MYRIFIYSFHHFIFIFFFCYQLPPQYQPEEVLLLLLSYESSDVHLLTLAHLTRLIVSYNIANPHTVQLYDRLLYPFLMAILYGKIADNVTNCYLCHTQTN